MPIHLFSHGTEFGISQFDRGGLVQQLIVPLIAPTRVVLRHARLKQFEERIGVNIIANPSTSRDDEFLLTNIGLVGTPFFRHKFHVDPQLVFPLSLQQLGNLRVHIVRVEEQS